jgi:hypothetical protein
MRFCFILWIARALQQQRQLFYQYSAHQGLYRALVHVVSIEIWRQDELQDFAVIHFRRYGYIVQYG